MTRSNLQLFSVGGALMVVSTQMFLHFSQWSRFRPIVWPLFLLFEEAVLNLLKHRISRLNPFLLERLQKMQFCHSIVILVSMNHEAMKTVRNVSFQLLKWTSCLLTQRLKMTSKRPYLVRLLITGLKTFHTWRDGF